MIPLEIPRRSRHCCRGTESFQPGMAYVSRLTLHKEKECVREDFCKVCWEKEEKELVPSYLTLWKGEIPKKTLLEKKTDRLEKALEILRQGLENGSEEDFKEAYLIALFLQRKKWLALRGDYRRKGIDKLLFEVVETEEILEIPKVTLAQRDSYLQRKIAQKLTL